MFGLAGKFQRRRESDLEQESNLTTNPRIYLKKSKYGIDNGYKNDSNWSSNWSNDTMSTSVGHPITFEVTRSSRKRLSCMLITVSLLLLLLIIAIILAYAMNVLVIKLPSSSSTTHQPYSFITSTLSPNSTFEPIPLPNFTFQPFPPPFPTPLPPYKPAIVTLPYPSDRLQKRTLLCQMYILNQADEAYVTHNHFKYRQSSQKIQNAIDSQLKQSSLQPYLENVYVWYLYNSGPHLAVEFSIILLVPSHTNIGLTTVKNVFLSILPGIEEQLNGTHIDRNSFSVQYLYN
uniref:SEA domain-containing protein n=1 Tax=Onchocerca volvulus TaxID=6282 RepID=A0A2K6W9P4_ONCVO